jgi:hypothetical protein
MAHTRARLEFRFPKWTLLPPPHPRIPSVELTPAQAEIREILAASDYPKMTVEKKSERSLGYGSLHHQQQVTRFNLAPRLHQ